MKKYLKKMKLTTKIILIENILYMLFGALVYPLIPYILNYPPESTDNVFQTIVVGMQYTDQFLFLLVLGLVLNTVILYILFKKVNLWDKIKEKKIEYNKEDILKIRNICANGLYKLVPIQLIVTSVILLVVFTLTSTELILTLKIMVIIDIWVLLSSLLLYVFAGSMFHQILMETYYYIDKIEDKDNKIYRISIQNKLMIQCLSTVMIMLFVITLFGYSRIHYERGEFLKEKELNDLNIIINEIKSKEVDLKSLDKKYFLINESGEEVTDGFKLTKFAKEYILHYPDKERTYYQYGSSIEGVYKKIEIDNEIYYFGEMYDVMPGEYTMIYLIFDGALFVLYSVIVFFFARSIKYDLDIISKRLKEIGESKTQIGSKLPITSNDEISDLADGYNHIQKNTESFINEIKKNQEIIASQGQLAVLGELAGGVAHDINTPISAIKTGVEILKMETSLSQNGIDTIGVIDRCTEKVINIVNSMRNQMRNLGSNEKVEFDIESIINDIMIITKNELMKNKCSINININDKIRIKGEPTKLSQVLINLIINAMQAYKGKNGIINLELYKENNVAVILVEDFAGGIDEKIKPFIFQNILTTKGTGGTGLGLYLAHSVIKGDFGGEIYFETKIGKGTKFIIRIPIIK